MIRHVYGVDFSGAREAGANLWIAHIRLSEDREEKAKLIRLDRLADLAGTSERSAALAHLVGMIRESKQALWGIDFPFALPIEIGGDRGLAHQIQWVRDHVGDAYTFGRVCVERALAIGDKLHIRRCTDTETKTPFDCYHYRIICQTFHGMRDVLGPLIGTPGTIILPFDGQGRFDRAIVEACPGSTLKRWGVPHRNYKRTGNRALEDKHIANRKQILKRLRQSIELTPSQLRRIASNPGADALDAVVAGVGAWQAWNAADFDAIARHPRYRIEGLVFA
jgi:hypothetical protein